MKSNPCKECQSIYHTAMYHKPRTPLKRTAIKPKVVRTSASLPKKKRTTRAKAKDRAWDAFSAYIRTRDCLRFTGSPDAGRCVTCAQTKPYKELQAGHFVGGRGNAVLFDERIVYSQCFYCNQKPPMGLGGNYAAYTLFMMDEGYSREQIEGFLKLRHETKVYKLHDFIELEQLYKQKTKDLLT